MKNGLRLLGGLIGILLQSAYTPLLALEPYADFGVSGSSSGKLWQNDKSVGQMNSSHAELEMGVAVPIRRRLSWEGALYWDQWFFDLPKASILPTELQTVGISLQGNLRLHYRWMLQLAIEPEMSGDDSLSTKDATIPISVITTWKQGPQFMVFLAIEYLESEKEFDGGIGFIWKFARRWDLDVTGDITIHYYPHDTLTFYGFVGGDGGTYPITVTPQDRISQPKEVELDYDESRVGGGFEWELPAFDVNGEMGALLNRSFEFEDEEFDTYESYGGWFLSVSLTKSF